MTAPANRNPDEIAQKQITPVLNMVYNASSGQIEPQTSSSGGGGDASAANQATEIARLATLATEATLAAITPKLEEIRVLLNYPENTYFRQAYAVTPTDSLGIGTQHAAISVNFDGNVQIRLAGGSDQFIVYLRAGVVYPFKVEKVFATGTTATGIIVWR